LPDNLKSVLPTIEEIEAELSAGLQDENEGDDKDRINIVNDVIKNGKG